MNIQDTRKCNLMNLAMVARYFGVESSVLVNYYEEICADKSFLTNVNHQIDNARRNWAFEKGIFGKGEVSSVDWFAFERILIYVLIRHFRPKVVLETGVYYGGNSAFALAALSKNKYGHMVSIDYPDSEIRKSKVPESRHALVGDSELYSSGLGPGFMVPVALHDRWELIEGDSLAIIPDLKYSIDFYIHDSDHSMQFLLSEIAAAWEKLTTSAVLLIDDIDWSNAFYAFCVDQRLHPLLVTDNGKDDLRVRTGLAKRDHPRNSDNSFT